MRESASELTIEAIYDLRHGTQVEPVHAESCMAALSEAEWSELRALATQSGRSGNPVLRCGDCRKGVYARESAKGRRHCYHFAGDHSDCRWAGAVAGNVRSIDAEKFHGQQEGEHHKMLCRLVAEVLALDPATRTAGVAHRRYTRGANGQYAFPDVYAASWQGSPAAFEIQLATTHLPVISRREEFYADCGIRLVWIVGYGTDRLTRRAFRDIYMRNDGQILGMDEEVAAEARAAGTPRFRLYRLLPGPARSGFAPRWKERIVDPAAIDWGLPGDRPRSAGPSYDAYLETLIARDNALTACREAFYDALAANDHLRAESEWNKAADSVDGPYWSSLPLTHRAVGALGVLATLRTGRKCVHTAIPFEQRAHLAMTMMLEPRDRRCWTHAFELLCRAKGFDDLLEHAKVRQKCERNRHEQSTALPPDLAAGPVFNLFFPEGAFYRLSLDDTEPRDGAV